jgi:hypothetical protein
MPGEQDSRFHEERVRLRIIAVPGYRAQAAIAPVDDFLAREARDRPLGCHRRLLSSRRLQQGLKNGIRHRARSSTPQSSRQNSFTPTA